MKSSEIPEWALKYKTKGRAVRLSGKSCWCLYDVRCSRGEDGRPQTRYSYVGVIKEKEGLVTPADRERKKSEGRRWLERGFTSFLYDNFASALRRSLWNASGPSASDSVRVGIVDYAFGRSDDAALSLTWWGKERPEAFREARERLGERRIGMLSGKTGELFRLSVPDEGDRFLLRWLLLLAAARDDEERPEPLYAAEALSLLEKWGLEK